MSGSGLEHAWHMPYAFSFDPSCAAVLRQPCQEFYDMVAVTQFSNEYGLNIEISHVDDSEKECVVQ